MEEVPETGDIKEVQASVCGLTVGEKHLGFVPTIYQDRETDDEEAGVDGGRGKEEGRKKHFLA